jgi:hypothetical protein
LDNEMPSDLPAETRWKMDAYMRTLHVTLRRTVQVTVRGRDGGRGSFIITAEYGRTVALFGVYVARDKTVLPIDLVRRGGVFVDMMSGRTSDTAEALLPLAVRDAAWQLA